MAHHHHHHRKPVLSPELALASDLFDKFCGAATLKTILCNYRNLCEILNLKPTNFPQFYPKLKSKLCSWRAQALWNKFDKRANHKCYNRGKACPNTRVLIIGAGPCGLRAAIEAQLLGAKVVVIEKRDRMTRNNVLHLWPFVIHDLRALGAKKFFGKFCAGSIDHISIRQLQCILLKVALLLGVEIHEGVGFESLIYPSDQDEDKIGWKAKVSPEDHPVSQYEFDVLIGADGKRNTLEGFKRKEFRGKLAIAITANFINHRSEAEARVEEISGVAYIFNQKFFKDLLQATGIDLENIVYYKDDTHYFVMTAKKQSLLNKGVILNDYADTAKLLAIENINKDALMEYAREAADFSTEYKLPQLQFAVNHYGQPDVAMFDFTSMYAAENASRVIQHKNNKLLMCLVGDSLLEPFWPTGSGCARGFLSSMDACWVVRSWGSGLSNPLEVVAERESIYRLLNQTTPENLSRDTANYTLDPHTRYPNLNTRLVLPIQVKNLYASDDPLAVENCLKAPSNMISDYSKKRRRKDTQIHHDVLLSWLKRQVALYRDLYIEDTSKSFKNGLALCAIIHRYRPDLIDFKSLNSTHVAANNQLAFDILEKEYGILPVMTGVEMEKCDVPDNLTMLSYLTQIYDIFRGEIPCIHHHRMDEDDPETKDTIEQAAAYKNSFSKLSQSQKLSLLSRLSGSIPRKRYRESRSPTVPNRPLDAPVPPRKSKKRKSGCTSGIIAERKHCFEGAKKKVYYDVENNHSKLNDQKLVSMRIMKSMRMLQQNKKQENDSIPFEDYSMFVYRQQAPDFKERVKDLERKLLNPDRDVKELQEVKKNPLEEDFSGRVRVIETKLKEGSRHEKKPKDLLRAIGKIEKTDWNVKELEKKIEENKYGSKFLSSAAKVPKWNKQQFDDKFSAVKKKLVDRDSHNDSKYAQYDNTLKKLEQKLRNGTALEQGQRGANKVSAMAAQLTTLNQPSDEKVTIQKSESRNPVVISSQGASEMCHFCSKRVYLMERLSAEGRFFHRGCFRCEYCGISLRLGNYSFDRDGKHGSRFYCTQHFGFPGTYRTKVKNRQNDYKNEISNNDKENENVPKTPTMLNLNFLNDSTDTPERVEFENLDIDKEDVGSTSRNEMDEDEWTDHNFGTSANELASSDDVSDISDSEEEEEEENEDEFAQAIDIPALDNNESLEFTRRFSSTSLPASPLTETPHRKNSGPNSHSLIINNVSRKIIPPDESDSSPSDDSADEHISYCEFESDGVLTNTRYWRQKWITIDEESDTATGEEEAKVREMRMKGVRLKVPERQNASDSGSDTEVASDGEYTSSGDEDDSDEDDDSDSDENSATEISTDSEFERNHSTVIKSEIPDIVISESLPTRKGHLEEVQKIQIISKNVAEKSVPQIKDDSSSKQQTTVVNGSGSATEVTRPRLPFVNPNRGDYYLNRTQSTEGVASKISLELKKKYLLGDSTTNTVKKSGSTSVLDTKFKSLVDQISEHQKLLNPAPEPSVSMQAFLDGSSMLKRSPTLSPTSSTNLRKSKELTGLDDFKHVCDPAKNTNVDEIVTKEQPVEVRREPSPVFETSIVVPDLPRKKHQNQAPQKDTTTSTSDDSSAGEEDEERSYHNTNAQISLPKVEIHNSQGELLPSDADVEKNSELGDNAASSTEDSANVNVTPTPSPPPVECKRKDVTGSKESSPSKIMAMPVDSKDKEAQILKHVSTPAELFISNDAKKTSDKNSFSDKSSPSTPTSCQGDDNTLAVFTETELSDWARDEDCAVSENFDDLILGTSNITYRRHQKPQKKRSNRDANAKSLKSELRDEFVHVCGRPSESGPSKPTSLMLANLDDMDIEFMDTGEDDDLSETAEAANPMFLKNSGYIEYVTSEDEAKTPLAEAVNSNYPSFSDYSTSRTSTSDQDITVRIFDDNINNNSLQRPSPSEEFDNFVHRFQDRISPFGNVKDSIDIRKQRNKSVRSPTEPGPSQQITPPAPVELPEPPQEPQGPSQKLEQLSKERSKQKNLIHEMVMSKLQSEGKSLQDRKSKRNSRSSLSPYSSSSQNSLLSRPDDKKDEDMAAVSTSRVRDNIIVENDPIRDGDDFKENIPYSSLNLSKKASEQSLQSEGKYAESFSLPDIRKALNDVGDKLLTPVLPSTARMEILKSTESIRQQARTRARLMSDSELGLSPEDKLKLLKQKIAARKAVQSAYYDYPKSNEFLEEKGTPNVLDALQNAIMDADCKNNNDGQSISPRSKMAKDKDRRKSIIQAVSDFFTKKSPTKAAPIKETPSASSLNKLKFKIALMSKERSKEKNLASDDTPTTLQTKYISDCDLIKRSAEMDQTPPRPPSPVCYTPAREKSDENISVTSIESKDDNAAINASKLRSSHRKTRRENQKRLRMAQEIQRQLEEIEVKQKELEYKGVNVEKALRNKNQSSESEYELMQELLDMIRERNELRKFEQKLLLKAKEIETEDPYSRLNN
ncbi:F-actin-monooxygenase Mical isoform X2 [Planococcus citri]|uniref:F-actin-monooxygenase Mical isoform X2 n=1 Tax=Planococcus citri TaxID=170843 RepID=UPI0031F85C85